MNEKDHPPPFHSQLRVYAITVIGKSQILDLYPQNYHCFPILWIKRKVYKGLTEFWMKEKNAWLIEIEEYMIHFCLWEMYRLLKRDCGDIIHKKMTF